MKKTILCMSILFFCSTGLLHSINTTNTDNIDIANNCFNRYYEFLSGKISLSEKDNANILIDIYDIFNLDENYNKYAFFDSNLNGVPELHLSSIREYKIIECINNNLEIVYSGSGYETLLNNGAILYIREGGGPPHISYSYIELKTDNNNFTINFEKYNTDNEDESDDLYLFDNIEISRSEYDEKTKNYLNINSDMIVWSNYWTFLFEKGNY